MLKTGYDARLYGYFVLVGGRKSDESYFYSHLISPSPFHRGDRVFHRPRELGRIGQTGNAAGTPCHVHFELRRGWLALSIRSRRCAKWDGWSSVSRFATRQALAGSLRLQT